MNQMLPVKTPTETKTITWDFSREASGSLSSPSLTKETITGIDPSAAGLTLSPPVASGSSVASLCQAGVDQCSYQIVCTVTDGAGQVHQSAVSLTVNSLG